MALQDDEAPKKEMNLAPKYKVFLSHSGVQKGFVEQLNLDLKQRNRHAFFDKDRDCLPITEKFPPLIFDAIQQCEVGVVVLTDEFLSSKWPMMELVEMVQTMEGNNKMKIMPIYFGVSVEDLQDKMKLNNWKAKWQGFEESDRKKHGNKRKRIDVSEWEGALTKLNQINGLVHNLMSTEVQFRKQVVEAICKMVQPFLAWDDSLVQGKLRFIEIFEKKVKEMPSSSNHDFQIVGLYGVGGIGKTTFCKFLCNHFEEEFCGKVCHVEFGRGTTSETLHMILKKLGNRTSEHLKDLSEDQCGEDLKNLIDCGKIFLAIDNISSDWKVIEEARRYLDTRYTSGSIVVFTARALELLTRTGINANDCLRMPELVEREPASLFLSHAKCMDVNDEIVMQCIQRSYFNRGDGKYHYLPLVLEVLGKHLRGNDPSTWVKNLELNPLRNMEHPVFQTLEISFDVLFQEDKDMFMDMAIFHAESNYNLGYRPVHANVYEWLRVVHGLRDIAEVKKRLYILKTKSLLEEVDDRKNIGMHDLWKEFASYKIKVGKEGRRWVCEHGVFKESILIYGGWKELERISISFQLSYWKSTKKLSLKSCSNLKALRLEFVRMQDGKVDLVGLSHLQILEIYSSDIQISSGMGQFKNLQVLIWTDIGIESRFILEQIGLLTSLQILSLSLELLGHDEEVSTALTLRPPSTMMSLLDLRDLKLLQVAKIAFGGFTKLRLSSKLRVLSLFRCDKLVNCPDLEHITGLEVLKLRRCKKLETLPNLQKLKNLKVLDIFGNKLLTHVLGLENMVSLQKLNAYDCSKLQALPNMSKLTNLQRLDVEGCDMLDYIPGMSSLTALRKLGVTVKCLKDTLNIRELVNLDEVSISGQNGVSDEPLQAMDLEIFENVSAELNLVYIGCELTNLHKLTRLKSLKIDICGFKRLPDMGNHMRLEFLLISECDYLRSWDGMGGLELMESDTNVKLHRNWTLAHLKILKLNPSIQLLDLSHFPQLIELCLYGGDTNYSTISEFSLYCGNDRLKLKKMTINNWPIFRLPDLSHFPELIELSLISIEKFGSNFALYCQNDHMKLKELAIHDCLIVELPDLSNLSSLKSLQVHDCQILTSLIASKPLTTLESVSLVRCNNLKELPTISYMRGLRKFTLFQCGVTLNRHECEELSPGCKFVYHDEWIYS